MFFHSQIEVHELRYMKPVINQFHKEIQNLCNWKTKKQVDKTIKSKIWWQYSITKDLQGHVKRPLIFDQEHQKRKGLSAQQEG